MSDKDLENNQTKNQLDKEFKEVVGEDPSSSTTDEEDSKNKDSEEQEDKKEESSEEESKETSSESEESSEEDEGDEVDSPDRPEKYIPIPKWQEKKKEWKQKEEKFNDKIEKLENKLEASSKEKEQVKDLGSNKEIKEFADEHSMKEKAVKELVGLVSKRSQLSDDVKESLEEFKKQKAQKQDEVNFENEFKSEVLPNIKDEFPDAPQKKIDKIKEELDALAHTKKLHKTPLEYIYARYKDKYSEMLNPPSKKTAESGSMGRKGEELTFSDVHNLAPTKRDKVIRDMKAEEYEKYMKWIQTKEGTGATIHREGKKIADL